MDRKFDLRLQADREALAAFLPIIDNRMINIPPAIFVDALKNTSEFLDNPEWLAYQWGTVGPIHYGDTQTPVELLEIAELGLELRDLSRHGLPKSIALGMRCPRSEQVRGACRDGEGQHNWTYKWCKCDINFSYQVGVNEARQHSPMPTEIHPSSFICDCDYRCEFSEGTVKEVKAASMKRKQGLIADDGLHEVIFNHGRMIGVYCPRENAPENR